MDTSFFETASRALKIMDSRNVAVLRSIWGGSPILASKAQLEDIHAAFGGRIPLWDAAGVDPRSSSLTHNSNHPSWSGGASIAPDQANLVEKLRKIVGEDRLAQDDATGIVHQLLELSGVEPLQKSNYKTAKLPPKILAQLHYRQAQQADIPNRNRRIYKYADMIKAVEVGHRRAQAGNMFMLGGHPSLCETPTMKKISGLVRELIFIKENGRVELKGDIIEGEQGRAVHTVMSCHGAVPISSRMWAKAKYVLYYKNEWGKEYGDPEATWEDDEVEFWILLTDYEIEGFDQVAGDQGVAGAVIMPNQRGTAILAENFQGVRRSTVGWTDSYGGGRLSEGRSSSTPTPAPQLGATDSQEQDMSDNTAADVQKQTLDLAKGMYEPQIEAATRRAQDAESRLDEATRKARNSAAELEVAERRLKGVREELDIAEAKIKSLKAEALDHEIKVGQMEVSARTQGAELEAAQAKIKSLKAELEEAQAKYDSAKAAKEEVETLRLKVATFETVTAERDGLKAQGEKATTDLAEAQTALEAAKADVTEKAAKITTLEAQVATLTTERDAALADASALREKHEPRPKSPELEAAEAEIKAFKEANAKAEAERLSAKVRELAGKGPWADYKDQIADLILGEGFVPSTDAAVEKAVERAQLKVAQIAKVFREKAGQFGGGSEAGTSHTGGSSENNGGEGGESSVSEMMGC